MCAAELQDALIFKAPYLNTARVSNHNYLLQCVSHCRAILGILDLI